MNVENVHNQSTVMTLCAIRIIISYDQIVVFIHIQRYWTLSAFNMFEKDRAKSWLLLSELHSPLKLNSIGFYWNEYKQEGFGIAGFNNMHYRS